MIRLVCFLFLSVPIILQVSGRVTLSSSYIPGATGNKEVYNPDISGKNSGNIFLIPGTRLSGADIAILGDSMSWIGGEDCQNPKGWTYHFKKAIQPRSITLYARSGATWTNDSATTVNPDAYSEVLDDDNVIYNQAERLRRDLKNKKIRKPDMVIIYAGANDAWFENRRPGCLEESVEPLKNIKVKDNPARHTSLQESIALVVGNLREILPKADILLVTPVELSKVTPEKVTEISEFIEKSGNELGCRVLRADRNVNIRHDMEKQQFTFTTDGVHTNPAGARLISDFIFRELMAPKTPLTPENGV